MLNKRVSRSLDYRRLYSLLHGIVQEGISCISISFPRCFMSIFYRIASASSGCATYFARISRKPKRSRNVTDNHIRPRDTLLEMIIQVHNVISQRVEHRTFILCTMIYPVSRFETLPPASWRPNKKFHPPTETIHDCSSCFSRLCSKSTGFVSRSMY